MIVYLFFRVVRPFSREIERREGKDLSRISKWSDEFWRDENHRMLPPWRWQVPLVLIVVGAVMLLLAKT